MHPEDYFGYINIGSDDCIVPDNYNNRTNWPCSKLKLEKKHQNIKAKNQFLKQIKTDEFMAKVLSSKKGPQTALDRGIHEARSWLNEI